MHDNPYKVFMLFSCLVHVGTQFLDGWVSRHCAFVLYRFINSHTSEVNYNSLHFLWGMGKSCIFAFKKVAYWGKTL